MSIWEKMGFGGYKGFSRESDHLLRSAVELAGDLGCEKADTGHLLLAILQQDHGAAARFLANKQIREPDVRRQLAEGRTSRVICYRSGRIVDLDIDEGLSMQKTLDPEELAVMETMTGL